MNKTNTERLKELRARSDEIYARRYKQIIEYRENLWREQIESEREAQFLRERLFPYKILVNYKGYDWIYDNFPLARTMALWWIDWSRVPDHKTIHQDGEKIASSVAIEIVRSQYNLGDPTVIYISDRYPYFELELQWSHAVELVKFLNYRNGLRAWICCPQNHWAIQFEGRYDNNLSFGYAVAGSSTENDTNWVWA
jgi:hypothetical protein